MPKLLIILKKIFILNEAIDQVDFDYDVPLINAWQRNFNYRYAEYY
jgi:hypothetical protein